jgi:16S rRNA pseudouridine516 synthase
LAEACNYSIAQGAILGAPVILSEDAPSSILGGVVTPTEALLTVTEGRYHQVRRMFAAAGNHVETRHREQLGGLVLPADLAPGQWRLATADEVASIFA